MPTEFAIIESVRATLTDDGGVLLNLETGMMFSINPLGAKIWARLQEGLTFAEILDSLTLEFALSREQLEGDVEAFVLELSKKGLVTDCAEPMHVEERDNIAEVMQDLGCNSTPGLASAELTADPPERGYHEPQALDTIAALIGLAAVDFAIKFKGFPFLHRTVKRWSVSNKRKPTRDTIGRVCGAVDRACTYYLKQALCLQRSALTTCLLRRQGIRAEMVIACRIMPYHGHAWVEVEGQVVNDRETVQEFYCVLERC